MSSLLEPFFPAVDVSAPSGGDTGKCQAPHNVSQVGEHLSECQELLEITSQTRLYSWNFSALEVLFMFLLKRNKNI